MSKTYKLSMLFALVLVQMSLMFVIAAIFRFLGEQYMTAANILAPTIAAIPICTVFLKSGTEEPVTKSMTFKNFVLLFCFLFTVNLCVGMLVTGLMNIFELIGMPIRDVYSDVEPLFYSSPVMVLYTAIIAPTVEELVFRGCILGNLQKCGKSTALIVSSLLFGLMHEILQQSISTFFIGMVLGLIFLQYGLKYAVIFHILNNAMALLLTSVGNMTDKTSPAVIGMSVLIFLVIIGGIYSMIRNRKSLRQQIFHNGSKELTTSVAKNALFWLIVVFHIAMMIIVQAFSTPNIT